MRTRNPVKEELVKQKAIELLIRAGVEGFSVNKLAKECGISVATLYIYYRDKDDLILKIVREEAKRMSDAMLESFDPELSFAEGLRQQWKNRAQYMLNNPESARLLQQIRSSSYQAQAHESFVTDFKETMGRFMRNAIARNEIHPMPVEVYWSVAFAPLYNLVRFHTEGHSLAGQPFVLTDAVLWQTFELVLKALTK
jgi:TetR/AcrR family transcriptional regulator, multidrug resistance operon repressor